MLLKVHRNELYRRVTAAGLDIRLLTLEENEYGHVTVQVPGSPVDFRIHVSPTDFNGFIFRYRQFAPHFPVKFPEPALDIKELTLEERGRLRLDGWTPELGWCPFETVSEAFGLWIERHAKPALADIATPDFWREASVAIPGLERFGPKDASGFSLPEQRAIRHALAQFLILIEAEFNPDQEQLSQIGIRLNYLADAVERLNRFDWKSVALSTMIGIATTLSLDTTAGHRLWALFVRATQSIRHLLGG